MADSEESGSNHNYSAEAFGNHLLVLPSLGLGLSGIYSALHLCTELVHGHDAVPIPGCAVDL
jgi:hypothetical protein